MAVVVLRIVHVLGPLLELPPPSDPQRLKPRTLLGNLLQHRRVLPLTTQHRCRIENPPAIDGVACHAVNAGREAA